MVIFVKVFATGAWWVYPPVLSQALGVPLLLKAVWCVRGCGRGGCSGRVVGVDRAGCVVVVRHGSHFILMTGGVFLPTSYDKSVRARVVCVRKEKKEERKERDKRKESQEHGL